MTGLDVEAVLRDEFVRLPEDTVGGQYQRKQVAHVAAVLRVEIESALADAWEMGRADERHHAAAVRDYAHWSNISAGPPIDPPNPYRPTLTATEGD